MPGQAKRATVMGLGLFGGGVGAVRYLAQSGYSVCVTDLKPAEELQESLAALNDISGLTFRLGGHHESDFRDRDLIVCSPAVPRDNHFLKIAAECGTPISSEIEIFLEQTTCPIVAITGSNGKTTTAHLCHALLRAAGRPAAMVGNMGISGLSRIDELRPDTILVLEISSFQLEHLTLSGPRFDAAIVLPITPNHLDRHQTFANYVGAKKRLLKFIKPQANIALHTDCQATASWNLESFQAKRLTEVEWAELAPRPQYLLGAFNRSHLGLSFHTLSAWLPDVDQAALKTVAQEFRPLPHRLEWVGEHQGITFINDSKATTPLATQAAIKSLDTKNIHLLFGGYDKGLGFQSILPELLACASVTVYGAIGPAVLEFASSLTPPPAITVLEDLDEATATALSMARAGETILLSPGHASLDQFANFEERGDRFRSLFAAYSSRGTL